MVPKKRRKSVDGDEINQNQEALKIFLFRNKIVEHIHELGEEILALSNLVERDGVPMTVKERIDGIKSDMSRLLTNDIMDILHRRSKRLLKEQKKRNTYKRRFVKKDHSVKATTGR